MLRQTQAGFDDKAEFQLAEQTEGKPTLAFACQQSWPPVGMQRLLPIVGVGLSATQLTTGRTGQTSCGIMLRLLITQTIACLTKFY